VKLRTVIPVIALALVCAAAVVAWLRWGTPASPGDVPAAEGETAESYRDRIPENTIAIDGVEELTSGLHSEEIDPAEDIAILQQVLHVYRQAHGANPEGGENGAIAERLLGRNGKRVRFLPEAFPWLNDSGELVDRWGTPYFFHPLSGEEMEIVSAGPDRELWTGDDVTMQ